MLLDIIKRFVMVPMHMGVLSEEDRAAAIEKAEGGDETEDETAARLAEGALTESETEEYLAKAESGEESEEEKAIRVKAGIETAAEKEEREAGGDGGEDGGSKTVPHKRFNQVVMQRNFYATDNERLIAENAELKKGVKTPAKEDEVEEYDYDEAEGRYLEAVKEGKTKDAIAIRREINGHIQADAESNITKSLNLDERLDQHGTAITEQQKVTAYTQQIEKDFPQFRKGHKDFDEDLVNDTLITYRGYMAGGMPQSQAIEKATKLVAKAAGIDVTKAPSKGLSEQAQETAAQRAEEARKRGQGANGKQPAKLPSGKSGAGGKHLNAEDIDPETLSDEEFDALPEATKKALRGDVVA